MKKDWAEAEATIYESGVDYKMYFYLYGDDNRAVRQIDKTKELKTPLVNVDYDADGNIIGIEVLAIK